MIDSETGASSLKKGRKRKKERKSKALGDENWNQLRSNLYLQIHFQENAESAVPASRGWIQLVFTELPFNHTDRAPAHLAPADPEVGAGWLLGKCPLQANFWQLGVTFLRTSCRGLRHPCSGHAFTAESSGCFRRKSSGHAWAAA